MSIDQLVPMWRLTDRMVRSGLVIACRFATSPTSTSPDFANPTTEGVVRPPSALGMTVGSPPSRTLTTEFVVPRSIPTAFGMWCLHTLYLSNSQPLRAAVCIEYSKVESFIIKIGPSAALHHKRPDRM